MKIPPSVTMSSAPLSSKADEADLAGPSIELQHRSSAAARSAPISSVNDPQVLAGLQSKMEEIFAPHETPGNSEALSALAKDRATQLQAMGQTAADVERLLDKATRMDRVTVPVQGVAGAVPFAVANTLLDTVPKMTERAASNALYSGFVSGALSGAIDTTMAGVMARSNHDTAWLKAPAEVLEPVMQQAQADLAQGTSLKRGLEQAAALQTYSLRNVVRGLVAATVTATKGPGAAAVADTVVTTAGGLIAGAGYGAAMRHHDLAAHRAGPEYLFGRQDWKKQYETLRDCSPTRDPLINSGKRLAKLPLDILTDTAKSLGKVTSASSIINTGVALGGGFSLVSLARSAVKAAATGAGLSPVAMAAADHATNTSAGVLAYGAYGVSLTTPDPLSEAAVKTLQEDVPPKVLSAAVTTSEGLATGVKTATGWLGSGAEAGSNAVAGLANRFRQRPARNTGPQGDSEV